VGLMRILDASGDTAIVWNVNVEGTVREAEALFDRMLAERKLAFARPVKQNRFDRSTRAPRRSSWFAPFREDDPLHSLFHPAG
jgi:hypothetical protein